ncbi:hypothetical protein D3C74_283300 [compost metagenome]
MAYCANYASTVVDGPDELLQEFVVGEVPHGAMTTDKIDGIVLVRINYLDPGRVVEACSRGFVLGELHLNRIIGIDRILWRLPALDGGEVDEMSRIPENLPGMSRFCDVVSGGFPSCTEFGNAGEDHEDFLHVNDLS